MGFFTNYLFTVPTTPAKTDLKAQFSMALSTISSCGVLITFGSPTEGTNGGLRFLTSCTAGMIELSGISSLGNEKFWYSSAFGESAMLDYGIVPDLYGRTQTRKSGITDVSFVIQQEFRQDGVPNISTRILANAGGYTDICDCLCSYNTCSSKEYFLVEIWPILLRKTSAKDLFTYNCECLHVQHSVPSVLKELFLFLSSATWTDNTFSVIFQPRAYISKISGRYFLR